MSLLVTPDTLETRPVLQRAKSVFPVPRGAESSPLKHVATREADKGLRQLSAHSSCKFNRVEAYRVQLFQCLSNVDTQTVLAALVGRREQTDEVEVKGAIGCALL